MCIELPKVLKIFSFLLVNRNIFCYFASTDIHNYSWAKNQRRYFKQDKRERPYGGVEGNNHRPYALRMCVSHTYGGVLFYHKSYNMTDNKISKAISLNVTDSLSVTIFPNSDYGFLITSAELAKAYGRNVTKIYDAFTRAGSRIKKGIHYIDHDHAFMYGIKIGTKSKLFTKKGFFVFCDYLKVGNIDAILALKEKDIDINVLIDKSKNSYVVLSKEQLVDILSDVVKIEDLSLRLSITNKLNGGR